MKKKILIIEDDKVLQQALIYAFEMFEYEVCLASDGQEGVEKAKSMDCDLILLDIILPVLDGFQVLCNIRKCRKKKVKNVPIIILTNLAQEEDAKKGVEMGANDYWIKTDLSIQDIVKKIDEFFI